MNPIIINCNNISDLQGLQINYSWPYIMILRFWSISWRSNISLISWKYFMIAESNSLKSRFLLSIEFGNVLICNFGVNWLECTFIIKFIKFNKLTIKSNINLFIFKKTTCFELNLRNRIFIESCPFYCFNKPSKSRNELLY